MTSTQKTASIIIIGDEILSGQIRDENSYYLIQKLNEQGVQVKYCITIPDDREIIATIVKKYAAETDWVFTSGGIGATPDDITLESIAHAYGVPLVCNPVMLSIIKDLSGERYKPELKKMACLPEGTFMIQNIEPVFPALQFQNIYILPGIPEFFRVLFNSIKSKFFGHLIPKQELNFLADESEITAYLIEALKKYPKAKIGSYPSLDKERWKVKIIIEHEDEKKLGEVVKFLRERLQTLKELE